MGTEVINRIQESLETKRENLIHWLGSAPEEDKEICLACEGEVDEQGVQAHLQVIDSALEKATNQELGVCEVCHGRVEEKLLEMDYTACICLDDYSDEERRQLETELEMTQAVQRALLPRETPNIPGVDLAAFSRPAQIVGGDYFDFFRFRDGTHGMVIADVEGHGVSSGMLMSGLQTALHTLIPDNDSPVPVLERINRFYIHNINLTTFVTVFLSRFDPATRQLTYVSAGHNPPLWLHVNGRQELSWLKPTAAAIGLMEDYQVHAESLTLSPGDVLLLYTDGITEATNAGNEPFGINRLADVVQGNARQPAQELVRAVRQSLSAFCGDKPMEDDITMLVCKVQG
jgi:sigma-B regulation protein RsbU (phosphoserine phosphatase)